MKAITFRCLPLLLLALLASCHPQGAKDETPDGVQTIDYFSLQFKDIEEVPGWNRTEYILLRVDADKEVVGVSDQIKLLPGQNRIYILDFWRAIFAAFDMSGRFLSTIGQKGNGPNEYFRLMDFDVDRAGNIYAIDGTYDKMYVYNPAFECLGSTPMPFEADVLCILDNDSLLYGLASWNKGTGAGFKIGRGDKRMNLGDTIIPYTTSDPRIRVSDYQFGKSKEYIAYFQAIDNDVLAFSRDGQLKKTFHFDFGSKDVPTEVRNDIEKHLKDFEQYTLLKKILAVTDRYIIGYVEEHREDKFFMLDYKSGTCYKEAHESKSDRAPINGYCDQGLVSFIEAPMEELPDSVSTHVEQEQLALQIRRIE